MENSLKSFSLFGINTSFRQYDRSTWDTLVSLVNVIELINLLKIIIDTAERAVKLMEYYNETLILDNKQKLYLLQRLNGSGAYKNILIIYFINCHILK